MKSKIEALGIVSPKEVYANLTPAKLVEFAIKNGEGILSDTGALVVETGKYTGRSPDDRFVVDYPEIHDEIDWGKVNVPITREKADKIFTRLTSYLQNRDLYVFEGYAGADKNYALPIRVVCELASSCLFATQAFIRPSKEELQNFVPGFTVICAPGMNTIPELDGTNSEAAIIVDFEKKMVLIAASRYSGEIKKSVFSVMNYLLPHKDVFPMHCSANIGKDGDAALFFGLSGTGKTTLSADPNRFLIGDDEHGWSKDGVFNFEGGCYAKCIDLSAENEPEIYGAVKFGTLVENVILDDETRKPDYTDRKLTENTRAAYPVEYIPNCVIPGTSKGAHPKAVIFLTADAFGVLPPISKLDKNMAMYHFVSGYTSKLAGTERGVKEPQTTFSTCFGAPFLPLHPSKYAEMLGKRIDEHGSNVYLINTGWSGGPYGVGKRMSIKYTRAMVTAALTGELEKSEFVLDPIFNVYVPKTCPNVPDEVLSPRDMWADKAAYDKQAKDLAKRFVENFKKYDKMPKNIVDAGPKA
ncbi:MAG: phosphoenolpyruvate carboxykinase (ATP) [Clostridia bacterium]|nr:phosphoenolpyruvate carboxykinase (ATP) [Clostridia bacterium]